MPTLDFKGKQFIYAHHLTVPFRTLKIDKEKSHTKEMPPSLDDNLIIHGDNLHALKALLPKYAGKIKCIYIDPPYNTGNENWVYNDNVNSPMMQAWLEKNSPIDIEDLERHDKWLCMMWPRLHLLRELLAEDGVIFISIDDNEMYHLHLLMNEIFGEVNFIACLPTIMNLKGNNDEFGFAGTHEYTFSWAKNRDFAQIGEFVLDDEGLESWLVDDYGFYKKGANLKSTGVNAPRTKRPNLYFPIYVNEKDELTVTEKPNTEKYEKIFPLTDGEEMSWRWSKEKITAESYNIIVERTNSGFNLYKKQRPNLGDIPSKKPKSLFYKPEYSSGNGTAILKQIFDSKVFNNPKPIQLLKDIICLSTKKDDIILDSFAGSGTTAHAVLALNKEDGGNRKFILVECEDYADNITAERVRRVINGVENAKDENLREGLGGSFTYCTLGESIDTEGMLTGDTLPTYETLANYIAYTATGRKLEVKTQSEDYCFGETKDIRFYLIYEPTLEFLESNKSALDASLAEQIAGECKATGKKAYIYASHKFMSQKELTPMGITFCQLPYSIYQIA
ncbi:site-specific DNA-methyltransferase [Candidatus Poribacteria bacterium]|nr:site-specific DNA-methyltransferase [Candidatus Poribacteria bacterium]